MRHTFQRSALLGCALLAATALAGAAPACAQGKPLPPPASDVTPPVELTITMQDAKPVCAPADLRLPADTNITLNVTSQADVPVTITMPGQFEKGRVLHADGDLIHVMSEKGYLVKEHGKGTLKLRTMKPGEETYACTSTRNQDKPFEGKLVLIPPAN